MARGLFPNAPRPVAKEPPSTVPLYGTGIPGFEPGNWRKYLFDGVAPIDVLNELGLILVRTCVVLRGIPNSHAAACACSL